ncbi:MAG TPA: flagellar biosynthesis protein FlhB [Acidobacteriota bacterium]|nr:flagellar biosynthesis protein FlhB [Acidobacteriota bacterium]
MAKSDKTEKPTPKKRRDAREKGQVARSRDLSQSFVFLNAVLFMGLGGAFLFAQMQQVVLRNWKAYFNADVNLLTTEIIFQDAVFTVMKLAAPLVLLTLLIGFASQGLQSGFLISSHNLKPKLDGLNPKQGLQKIFSKRGLMQLVKSVMLIVVIAWLGYDSVSAHLPEFQKLSLLRVEGSVALMGKFLFALGLKVALFLAVLGVIDFVFQKYKFEEDLKQTKQEVKEDLKNTEGNPLVKGRIRRLQREMARKRMMASVPEADVVITNPSHYAVALKYDMEAMAAPLVLAKGQGHLAQKIKDLASEHDIPQVENVPLAQALYKSAEVGAEIPGDLFKAVAQVLAYVYRLKEENWH